MHSIFAIEPEAINNWKDLRYVIEKFGINKGLLIGRYPKAWGKMVIEACQKNRVQGREFLMVVEKLNQIKKDRMVPLGLPYTPPDWCKNTLKEEIIHYLDAVIVKGKAINPKHHQLDAVDEIIFENHRETKVKRQAKYLAKAATYVLFNTAQIIIIDPYFTSDKKCIKVLNELLLVAEIGKNNLKKVSIFMAFSKDPRSHNEAKSSYQDLLKQWTDKGIVFEITRLRDDALQDDFHARYLVTDNGGLRYDRGFVEPNDHAKREQWTDVVCLESETNKDLKAQYIDNLEPQYIVDKLMITS